MKNSDRLVVGVLGNENSGKSTTWNRLFGATVRTGRHPRDLELRPGETVNVFLVSGSPEERELYVGEILGDQDSRIVLCSMQYTKEVHETLDHFIGLEYMIYIQWLNPGYRDHALVQEDPTITKKILDAESVFSIRDASSDGDLDRRVQEIREFIYGWAKYRDLVSYRNQGSWTEIGSGRSGRTQYLP